MIKKLLLLTAILGSLSLFLNSCSSTSNVHTVYTSDTLQTYIPTTGIVFSILEQVRLAYLDALKYQEQKDQTEALKSYEKAVELLNNLSFYPDIDSVSDYVELEKSVLEDYQRFIDTMDELPENVSLLALKEWLDRKIPSYKNLKSKFTVSLGEIPLEVNEYVENYIDFFTGRGRYHMRNWIARSGKYFPMMIRIFREEKVPEGLIYLSAIESGLNPKAVSRAKAVGLWQFMRATGSRYGLNGNFYFDDRRHPEKATRAAAQHLKDLYISLGDWYLALAAYNCGEARVRKAMMRKNSNNYWEIMEYLPKETRGYVPQFIAASLIMSNPEKYNFNDVEIMSPIEYETFIVYDSYDLGALANAANISSSILDELNPELLQFVTPPAKNNGYALKIPKGTKEVLAANYSKIPPSAKKSFIVHRVRSGETISKIAERYGVTPGMIADANNISKKVKLKRNTKLIIPIPYDDSNISFTTIREDDLDQLNDENNSDLANNDVNTPEISDDENSKIISSDNSLAVENNSSQEKVIPYNTEGKKALKYKVKKEDSITKIAELFETRITDIRIWNNIPYNKKIAVGDILTIFVPVENYEKFASLDFNTKSEILSTKNTTSFSTNQKKILYYSVKKGESLSSIANRYKVSLAELKEWNRLKSNNVRKGLKLKIYVSSENLASLETKNTKTNDNIVDKETTYKVRKGETLSQIAQKLNVSVNELKEWNNLTSNNLTANQKLIVREPNTKIAKGDNYSAKKTTYHTVRKGDTLDEIAKKFKMSVADLKKLNKLKSNTIQPGKKLIVNKR